MFIRRLGLHLVECCQQFAINPEPCSYRLSLKMPILVGCCIPDNQNAKSRLRRVPAFKDPLACTWTDPEPPPTRLLARLLAPVSTEPAAFVRALAAPLTTVPAVCTTLPAVPSATLAKFPSTDPTPAVPVDEPVSRPPPTLAFTPRPPMLKPPDSEPPSSGALVVVVVVVVVVVGALEVVVVAGVVVVDVVGLAVVVVVVVVVESVVVVAAAVVVDDVVGLGVVVVVVVVGAEVVVLVLAVDVVVGLAVVEVLVAGVVVVVVAVVVVVVVAVLSNDVINDNKPGVFPDSTIENPEPLDSVQRPVLALALIVSVWADASCSRPPASSSASHRMANELLRGLFCILRFVFVLSASLYHCLGVSNCR